MTRALLLALALLLLAAAPAAHAGEPDPTVPAYDVALTATDGGFRWTGRETLTITNPGAAPLADVWIRLWGNGVRGCRQRAIRVANPAGGSFGRTRLSCTAIQVRLDAPLAPGARGSVSFDVDIRVPRNRADRFGRGGEGVALLSNALPALAHREGDRWRLDRFMGFGEAWTYPAATYTVRLDAPAGVAVAAPGVLQPDGTRRLENGRDYSWAAGRLRSMAADVAGVRVTVWGGKGARVRKALALTRQRLPQLVELFGPYGWPDLQVIVTRAAAMEHTGLIMTPARDFIVIHELAHEWWFGSVGDDQAESPWLDEGFATWAEGAILGSRPCRRPGPLAEWLGRPTSFWLRRPFAYGAVYFEGGCLLELLERRMGREVFRAALREYAIALRYGWSTEERFRAAMEAASPKPLGFLWRRFGLR